MLAGIASMVFVASALGRLLFSSTDRRRIDRSVTTAIAAIALEGAFVPGSRVRYRLERVSKRYVDPLFRMPRITES